jgi:hypothetical protein
VQGCLLKLAGTPSSRMYVITTGVILKFGESPWLVDTIVMKIYFSPDLRVCPWDQTLDLGNK